MKGRLPRPDVASLPTNHIGLVGNGNEWGDSELEGGYKGDKGIKSAAKERCYALRPCSLQKSFQGPFCCDWPGLSFRRRPGRHGRVPERSLGPTMCLSLTGSMRQPSPWV